eukprot:jgi/Mesvir1/6529/Mv16792-RA.1
MTTMNEKRDPAGQQDTAVGSVAGNRVGLSSRSNFPAMSEESFGGEAKEPMESELSEDVQQLGITSHAGTSVDYTLMSVSIPSITVLCLMVSYTVFITALWASEFKDARNGEGKEAFEAYNPQTYEWTMIAFGVTFMVSTLQLCFERDPAKSALSFYLCYVHFCAFFSYYLLTVPGFLPVTIKHNGRGLVLGRYVEWAHTSPVLVLLCGKMAVSSQKMVVVTFALNWAMLVLGLFGELFPMPWMLYFYLASVFCLFLVSKNLWWMFESAMREDTLNLNRNIVRVTRLLCLVLWWMFGVVWVVAQMNAISMETEEVLYQVLDLATKAMFSSALLLGNYHTLEQRRIVAMIALEEWKRVKLIRELRNALTHKDRFLSSMSHELRTPLNGIIGLSDSVLDGACGAIDKKLRSSILTIRNSGARLQALINNILDTTSFCGNSYELHKEKVNVHEIVDDVMFLLRPLVRQGVQLVNNIDADAVGLLGDRACIIQILYSLLGNSVKFTEKGSITVYGQLCQNDTLMAISVADTGIGIAEANLKGIFAAFQQVDMSLTRKYGGTGLGLSLVEHLVGAHGGVIEVKSKAGFGTVFTFTLPVVPSAQSQEKSLISARPSTLSLDEEPIMDAHRTHEILVVDANPEVHMKLVLLLPHCTVIKTSTSEEARSILAEHVANRSPPSLVAINVKLTPEDGYSLCKLIRETYPQLDIPVILMHEAREEPDLERGREVGGTDFLALPIERQELLQCVQPFLLQMETPGSFALLRTLAPSWVDTQAAEVYYTHATILAVGVIGLGSISKDEFSAKLEVIHSLYVAFDELLDEQDVVKLESNGEVYLVMKGIQMQREPATDGKGGSSSSSSSTFLGTSHRQRHHNARTMLDLAAKMGKAAAALQGPDSFKGGVKLKMGVASGPLCSRELGLRPTGPCYFGDALDYARHLERLLSSSGMLMAESTYSLLEDGTQGKSPYEMQEVDCPAVANGATPLKCYECRMPFSDSLLQFSELGMSWRRCMGKMGGGIEDYDTGNEALEDHMLTSDERRVTSGSSFLSDEDSFTKSSSQAVGGADSATSLAETKVGAWLSINEAEDQRRDHDLLASLKERMQMLDLDSWQSRARMEEVMAQASYREAFYEEETQKMMSAIKLLNDEVIHLQQREKMLLEAMPPHETTMHRDQDVHYPDGGPDWEGRLLYPAPIHARTIPGSTHGSGIWRGVGIPGANATGTVYDPSLGPRRRKPHSFDDRAFLHPRAAQDMSMGGGVPSPPLPRGGRMPSPGGQPPRATGGAIPTANLPNVGDSSHGPVYNTVTNNNGLGSPGYLARDPAGTGASMTPGPPGGAGQQRALRHSITLPVGAAANGANNSGSKPSEPHANSTNNSSSGFGGKGYASHPGGGVPPPGDVSARRWSLPAMFPGPDMHRSAPITTGRARPGPLSVDVGGPGGMEGGSGVPVGSSSGGNDFVGSPVSSRGSPRVGTLRGREAAGQPAPGPASNAATELLMFLQNMQLEHYFELLHKEAVSVEMLPHMDDHELRQMGIVSMGARMRLRGGATAYLSGTGPL